MLEFGGFIFVLFLFVKCFFLPMTSILYLDEGESIRLNLAVTSTCILLETLSNNTCDPHPAERIHTRAKCTDTHAQGPHDHCQLEIMYHYMIFYIALQMFC